MKQIIKLNIFVLLILNLIVAAILASVVLNLTPTRNIIEMSLKIDLRNKYTDYIQTKNIYTSFISPKDFVMDLDNKLRSNSEVYGLENECMQIEKIKKTLPISIVSRNENFEVIITSTDQEALVKCSSFVTRQVELYNERVRERYRENYVFFDELNKDFDLTMEKENETINQLFQKFDKIMSSYFENRNDVNIELNKDIDIDEIRLVQTYISLVQTYIGLNSSIKPPSKRGELNKQDFFALINNVSPIKIETKSKYTVSPPEFYKLYLSFLSLGILILIIIKHLTKSKKFIKKII